MEDTNRSQASALNQALLREPHQFDFYQAVRLLENGSPVKVGHQGSVAKERVRFSGYPTMAFPTCDIPRARAEKGDKITLESNFFGLYGAASPLPAYLTESIIAEQQAVESQDHQVYFISQEEQLQRLRDFRLDVSVLLNQASTLLRQVKAGTQIARVFSEQELIRYREMESLESILSTDYQAFRKGELLLQLYEAPAARQRQFVDLFNHRLTSLLYRSWRKYQPGLQYQKQADDEYSEWMFALMGAPGKSARANSSINWPRLLGFTGLIAMNSGSCAAMTSVIGGYFGDIPVDVAEYIERWADIPPDQQNRLGSANSQLGNDLSLGGRVKDHCGKFRVRMGPLPLHVFARFLPDGDDHNALLELIDVLMPEHLCFDIELILKGDEVPMSRLGTEGAPKLGWIGWLGNTRGQDQSVILNNF